MSYVTAIIAAGGKGLRFKSKLPKLLNKINSVKVITYSLKVLDAHPLIKDIIIVVNFKNEEEIRNEIRKYHFRKINKIVKGGLSRQDSVRNGLAVIDNHTDLVLIHDAARPFVDKDMVSRVIKEAKKSGASCVGVPVKNTIKKVKSPWPVSQDRQKAKGKSVFEVDRTLDRQGLMEIQTPQVFRKELILKAHRKFINTKATDDASLVEKLGVPVRVVMGSCFNIKITTPEDLVIAEAILKIQKSKCKYQNYI